MIKVTVRQRKAIVIDTQGNRYDIVLPATEAPRSAVKKYFAENGIDVKRFIVAELANEKRAYLVDPKNLVPCED